MVLRRLGDTISAQWPFYDRDGNPLDLRALDLELEVRSNAYGAQKLDFTIEGDGHNIIAFTWEGTEQKYTGKYNFTLYVNRGKSNQRIIDACTEEDPYPLKLVSCTHKTQE